MAEPTKGRPLSAQADGRGRSRRPDPETRSV